MENSGNSLSKKIKKENSGNWSLLPDDLFEQIVSHLNSLEDFMAMTGACTSWRAAATIFKDKLVCKVPLLMLSEKHGSNEREFYSLSKRKICTRMSVPFIKDKRCIDVGFGWILALSCSDEGRGCLLNPFSSARRIQILNYKKFPYYDSLRPDPTVHFIRRAWLTADPSKTSDFSLVVSTDVKIHELRRWSKSESGLGFWRNGGLEWTRIKCTGVHVATYYKRKIWMLDYKGNLLIWDPQDLRSEEPDLVLELDNAPTFLPNDWCDYMVESTSGELLVIRRNNISIREYLATGVDDFRVMRVDPELQECVEIDGLGKDAVFLGQNAAVSVDATMFPGTLKPNCIYFTDDCLQNFFHHMFECPKDMGVYDVGDGSIERFDVESFSRICPPLWLFPSL